MIVFSNPGELDLRLITTFGVSVKESKSPIGKFGTGLKYAIAGILRNGMEIEIFTGDEHIVFKAFPETMRGQTINLVKMLTANGSAEWVNCGFSTSLGQHWQTWMYFRELYSNALDENGRVDHIDSADTPDWNNKPCTIISVSGEAFEDIYDNMEDYFLTSKPLWTLPGKLSIHEASASLITYKGIRMAEKIDSATTASFTYNLLGDDHPLTEDRTLSDEYHAMAEIGRALLQCEDRDIITSVINSESGLEPHIDWDWAGTVMSDTVKEIGLELIRSKKFCPATLRIALKKTDPAALIQAEELILPTTLEEMIAQAPKTFTMPAIDYAIYSVISDLQKALETSQLSAKYWEKCARNLATTCEAGVGCLTAKGDETLTNGDENAL